MILQKKKPKTFLFQVTCSVSSCGKQIVRKNYKQHLQLSHPDENSKDLRQAGQARLSFNVPRGVLRHGAGHGGDVDNSPPCTHSSYLPELQRKLRSFFYLTRERRALLMQRDSFWMSLATLRTYLPCTPPPCSFCY